MTLKEKILYHQIVPAKLAADWALGGVVSYYLFWRHYLIAGILVTFIPSVLASLLIIRYKNLQPYKTSKFGCYIKKFMTSTMQAIRSIGGVLVAIAAWYHSPIFTALGILLILYGWLNGLFRLR